MFISFAGVLIFRQMWPILSHKNGGWALLHLEALLSSHFLFFKSALRRQRGVIRGVTFMFLLLTFLF